MIDLSALPLSAGIEITVICNYALINFVNRTF